MNQLMNMFTRLVARRAMNWGINKGMGTLARRGKGTPDAAGTAKTAGQTKTAGLNTKGDIAKRMRTLARLTRR